MSLGNVKAIGDWFRGTRYSKNQIDEFFIKDSSGLIPYDLMITGYRPEQMIKLVGQTSGETYNLCLAALMGDSMGKAKIYDPVINSDVLNSVDGKIFVKGNIAFCNVQPNYKTTGSSNKHIFTIPEEIRPCSFVTFETGDGAHTTVCGYGYIDPTDGKVYTSNEHNTYQYMSMSWLIPDEIVNFKSKDSSVESMLGGVIGVIGKDMAYMSTKVHLGSHATGWKIPLLELPESIAPVNNYDFIPVVRMLSAVNGNDNSFRDAHYELNNDKCCVNVFVYDGDYDIWVTGYWKFK